MTLFVYVTENCRADSRTHGLAEEIDRLASRVERTQSVSTFDTFPSPYLVKKKLGGRQGRLIAEHRFHGDVGIIVFLSILIRGSREYDEFQKYPHDYGEANFRALVSDEEVANFVNHRTEQKPPPEKPSPSEEEYLILYDSFTSQQQSGSDILVCETREWADAISQESISNQLALLSNPVLQGLQGPEGLHFFEVPSKSGWGVWTLKHDNRLLLITPVTKNTETQCEVLANKYKVRLQDADSTQILKESRRAYPEIILADDDLWIKIEKDSKVNIALSPEESEVLESAKHPSHPFPLFINGRAGSGKSTILQYLFADILFKYLNPTIQEVMAPPIYLTASAELLRNARDFIGRLLTQDARFSVGDKKNDASDLQRVFDEAFKQFYPFISSLVQPHIRQKLFSTANRIDYARFILLWNEKFGQDPQARKQFGPDISWHVIRSYIKGMSAESILEPEDYETLPENQLSVSPETYRTVYERVWQNWYSEIKNEGGLWDDQDLVRHVLDEDLVEASYPAVFCDEAQDFTRLELELLLRINLFSQRKVERNDFSRICFVFAGDQFQTLNPTGFRWDAIKSTFVEKFIYALNPSTKNERVDLNYQELQFNYRSSEKIVRFCNFVQALRDALFDVSELKPQRPWNSDEASFPVTWFQDNDASFWAKFREDGNIVLIIPCAEGEEAEFVKSDKWLRENIEIVDGVPINVFSAARAKGCEYSHVVVYGFGSNCEVSLTDRLSNTAVSADKLGEKELSLQYFLNRLYVAVSRAKRKLVVVDSKEGFARVWRFSTNDGAEAEMLHHLGRRAGKWADYIQGMTQGRPEDLTKDVAVNPLENAKAYYDDGLARRDYYSMRQAAQAYRNASNSAKAKECIARALEFEGKLKEAAHAFLQQGYIREALRCLWEIGQHTGWQQILNARRENPAINEEMEVKFAELIVQGATVEGVTSLLTIFLARIKDPQFAEKVAGFTSWQRAVQALLEKLLEGSGQKREESDWLILSKLLDELDNYSLRPGFHDLGAIYYSARRYSDAVTLWEAAGHTRGADFVKAKAQIESYPNNISSLANLKAWAELSSEYDAHSEIHLKNENQSIAIFNALFSVSRYEESVELAVRYKLADQLVNNVPALLEIDDALAFSAIKASIDLIVTQGKWEIFKAIIFGELDRLYPTWSGSRTLAWYEGRSVDTKKWLIKSFARYGDLSGAPESFRRNFTKYLKQIISTARKDFSHAELGAAVERTGRFSDSIQFYENLRQLVSDEPTKAFAQERLLVCKNRQLQHEKAQKSTGRTRALERQLEHDMARLKIKSIDTLPIYPELPERASVTDEPDAAVVEAAVGQNLVTNIENTASALSKDGGIRHAVQNNLYGKPSAVSGMSVQAAVKNTTESNPATLVATGTKATDVNFMLGHLEFKYSRKNQRLNITNVSSMEVAYFKVQSAELGGEMDFTVADDKTWHLAKWDLFIQLILHPAASIRVRCEGDGIEVRLDT